MAPSRWKMIAGGTALAGVAAGGVLAGCGDDDTDPVDTRTDITVEDPTATSATTAPGDDPGSTAPADDPSPESPDSPNESVEDSPESPHDSPDD